MQKILKYIIVIILVVIIVVFVVSVNMRKEKKESIKNVLPSSSTKENTKSILPNSFTLELKADYTSSGATRNYNGKLTFLNSTLVNGSENYFVGQGGGCKTNCNRIAECLIKNQQWVDKTSGGKCEINTYVSLSKEGIEQQIKTKEILPIEDFNNCPHNSTCYQIVEPKVVEDQKIDCPIGKNFFNESCICPSPWNIRIGDLKNGFHCVGMPK